jgi:flagellar P-ring protein precursor FlgI
VKHRSPSISFMAGALVLALGAGSAEGTTVQDLVELGGEARVVVQGLGLVVGLNGTGDSSKDSLIAARPFAKLLENMGNPVGEFEELARADAFAIVTVSMDIPPEGALDGERFDVAVEKLLSAESLEGGRLLVSLLRLPLPDSPDLVPVAFASGPLTVDPANPGSGIVRDGGQMIQDIRNDPVAPDGTLTLILRDEYAGFPVATTIAGAIDDEFAIDGLSDLTRVRNQKEIVVAVPPSERSRPALFIATLMTIPIDPSLIRTKARIVINERAGIITATGDVEIGPVAITHKGMRLSNIGTPGLDVGGAGAPGIGPPAPGATAPGAALTGGRWVGLDTTEGTSRTATRLTDLLAAFDRLNVPTEDQIDIIFELKRTGALHAEILGQ